MPVVYRCKHCGFILHVFVRVGQDTYGVPTPRELRSIYGGLCPRCGHRLEPPTLNDIIVKPHGPEELLEALEEAPNGATWQRILERKGLLTWLRLAAERRRMERATLLSLTTARHSIAEVAVDG